MSRLAVLRRPLSPDPAVEPDQEHAQRSQLSVTQAPVRRSGPRVGARPQDPVRGAGIEGAGIEGAGRHRNQEGAVLEAMPVANRPAAAVNDAATVAAAANQPRVRSMGAARTVTGGWVPSVSERLHRDGVGRKDDSADTVGSGPRDPVAVPDQANLGDDWQDEDWAEYPQLHPRPYPPAHREQRINPVSSADAAEKPDGDLDGGDLEDGDLVGDDLEDGHEVDEESIVGNPIRAVRARRVGRSWGRFAELWVPEPLRDARVDPGRRGAIVLLLVATLAAIVTAFGVWRDQPEPRPVESSAITALAVSAGPSTAASIPGGPPSADGSSVAGGADPIGAIQQTASPSVARAAEIVVSVTGLVAEPGVVTLPAGARVADAIAAAGGAAEGADLTGLNLAARLADGDSVVVGNFANTGGPQSGVSGDAVGQSAAAGSGAPSGGLVNLNTADEAALDTLPGVGPVMAKNILAWRETNGKFSSVEQLQEITGIGPSRYAQLSPLVTVS
jgi:competence protein ComEA